VTVARDRYNEILPAHKVMVSMDVIRLRPAEHTKLERRQSRFLES
jgi:hypothetical protein